MSLIGSSFSFLRGGKRKLAQLYTCCMKLFFPAHISRFHADGWTTKIEAPKVNANITRSEIHLHVGTDRILSSQDMQNFIHTNKQGSYISFCLSLFHDPPSRFQTNESWLFSTETFSKKICCKSYYFVWQTREVQTLSSVSKLLCHFYLHKHKDSVDRNPPR